MDYTELCNFATYEHVQGTTRNKSTFDRYSVERREKPNAELDPDQKFLAMNRQLTGKVTKFLYIGRRRATSECLRKPQVLD